MASKKKNIKIESDIVQTKEEKMIEKWIPFGFMIGTVIGWH